MIIVGTRDGRLLVYERLSSGMLNMLLYSTKLEGAVGAYKSIVAANPDQDQHNELYVAGSSGLRRFLDIPPAN